MEHFDWTQFTRRIAVTASMEQLYAAWSIPQEIERWFLKTADFTTANGDLVSKEIPVATGSRYTWIWHLYDDREQGTITAANGTDFIQFTFAGACLVDVKLTEEEGYTIVELTQKHIPTDEDSKQFIRLGCHTGWSFYLLNLKSVMEGGLDLRNKDTRLQPMLNN